MNACEGESESESEGGSVCLDLILIAGCKGAV